MRSRVGLLLAGAAALAAASGAHAAPPKTQTIDGKNVKTITWEAPVAMQNHAVDDTVTTFDPAKCAAGASDCDLRQFVYKPAAGVTGNMSIAIKWGTSTLTDLDLYVLDPDGGDLAHCGGFGGTGEIVSIPSTKLVSGKTYRVVTRFYQAVSADTVKGTVEFPSSFTPTDLPVLGPSVECAYDGTNH